MFNLSFSVCFMYEILKSYIIIGKLTIIYLTYIENNYTQTN